MKRARPGRRKMRGINVTRLMSRDGCNCSICGVALDRSIEGNDHPNYITFDHKTPRSAGGLTRPDNLRLAHQRCNNLRGNDPLIEGADE